jgi:predicted regulator of Ras-like GTPase activity (Roadblock/LC7/MglB family)
MTTTTAVSQEQIVQLLTTLKSSDVKSVALTTVEGRSLGSTVTESGARFKLGALSAASIAIATKTSAELTLGDLDQVHIVSTGGSLFLSAVGQKALLSVVAGSGADITQITRDMKRLAIQLVGMV